MEERVCCNFSVKWQHIKAYQTLVLLINRTVCLVFSGSKINVLNLQTVLFIDLITFQSQILQGNPSVQLRTYLLLALLQLSAFHHQYIALISNFPVRYVT